MLTPRRAWATPQALQRAATSALPLATLLFLPSLKTSPTSLAQPERASARIIPSLRPAALLGLAAVLVALVLGPALTSPASASAPIQLMQAALQRLSSYLPAFVTAPLVASSPASPSSAMPARTRLASEIYSTRPEWQAQLDGLPSLEQTGDKIPSIFLAHGRE